MGLGQRIQIVKRQIDRGGVDGTWYPATICPGYRKSVTNESCELEPRTTYVDDYCTLKGRESMIGRTTDWEASDTTVVSGSVTVKSADGTITYTEGSSDDYTVNYELGEIIRNDLSSIPRGATILVTYSWSQPCINPETGNPRYNCPLCQGRGVIYDTTAGTVIRGLLHIPNYESPLSKIGFFEMGDAIFTTTSLYKIVAKGYGDDHLYIRDIIVINDGVQNQVWRVLSKPETIQLANEYLAHKVHIRKIKEDETITDLIQGVT